MSTRVPIKHLLIPYLEIIVHKLSSMISFYFFSYKLPIKIA